MISKERLAKLSEVIEDCGYRLRKLDCLDSSTVVLEIKMPLLMSKDEEGHWITFNAVTMERVE